MKAGCGRFRRKVTSSSAFTTTSSRLPYQALRGLTRRLSPLLPLPARRSQVHLTSRAVNGLPSCHLTPERSLKLRLVPASSHDHLVARSGTIDFSPFCGTAWSYITRLLNTPIIGPWPAMVDSSWIDREGGLSKNCSLSTPPDFCAHAEPSGRASSSAMPAKKACCTRVMNASGWGKCDGEQCRY